MTTLIQLFTIVATFGGLFFFLAGSLGLLRFPDVYSRLHALTKADNLGFGLIALGVLPHVNTLIDAWQVLLIWLFVMIAGAVAGHLIAGFHLHSENAIPNRNSLLQAKESPNDHPELKSP